MLGIYERSIQTILYNSLFQGSVFYDIGANNGFFSLLGCELTGPSGFTYCFEPHPLIIKMLRVNLEKNEFSNYKIIQQAVSEENASKQLFFSGEGNQPRSSLIETGDNKWVEVKTITLDSFLFNNRIPDLVKIDVEGAEEKVLKGARNLIRIDPRPAWLVEIHSLALGQAVRQMFTDHGYVVNEISADKHSGRQYPLHILAD